MIRSWLVLALSFIFSQTIDAEVLVVPSTAWKYFKGTTEASSPDLTLWRLSAFNDSTWTTGNAPFHYGENIAGGTLLSDMQGNYSTVFFRKTFSVTGLSQVASVDLDVRSDDGFVAWVNGQQIASKNPPATITFDALASGNAAEPAQFETFNFPVTALLPGENILAIQLFNVSLAGSSDALFDAQVITKDKETISPTITRVAPTPGAVTNLTQISITFSEPVVGINGSDLRINDVAATAVAGSGSNYTFSFPQPPYGNVLVTWSIDANITDTAVPPNPFNRSDPTASFLYDLVDPTVPLIASSHPPQGLTVRSLSQIEILFNKSVTGVDAADLLVNGQAATNLVGFGSGPYLFSFPARPDGAVAISWAQNHGITDLAEPPNPFVAPTWNYIVNSSQAVPRIRINEFMAANETGLLDADGAAEDWIELYNDENFAVPLEGWTLTDDASKPNQWVFPRVTIGAKQHLVVFASGKDVRDPAAPRLHTNFKLNLTGEYLGLFSADAPRLPVSQLTPQYPEQRNDFSYGLSSAGEWVYFRTSTPGSVNGVGTSAEVLEPVHFSVERGFFSAPFQLTFHSPSPGAVVRYTFDGREPTETVGTNYTGPLLIDRTRMVRAAAFRADALPSVTRTHTFLFNILATRMRLPAMSLVTSSNNLYGTNGIMEVNPRNTTKHGMAWERPVSVELIRPEDNGGFQIDCGIRIQGGGYIRGLYDYRTTALPQSKYSWRLYFRGDYGAGKLNYPLFPDLPLESFDEIVLRAGMNDHSNPFIRDEMTRMLAADVGTVASHGTFVHLFLNGTYKGLYNPTERISPKFLQSWHGGSENWDVIAQMGEVGEGNAIAWNQLRTLANSQNPTNRAVYEQISERLDIDNFIDYLLVNIYAGTDDWPYNNWRAAREQAPTGKFRFYAWDAEWSFGYNNTPSNNTITQQLAGTSEIPTLFKRLRLSPEFRLRFADRAHKHFFNGGALTDERIRMRYESIRTQVVSSIPSFNNTMSTTWIAQRRRNVTNHMAAASLLLSSNAPVFNLASGRIARGSALTMSAGVGEIWFTTNGVDPRVPFTGEVYSNAVRYSSALTLEASTLVKARTFWSTNWSALSEGAFQLDQLGIPLRITEIMYNPPGGDAYEYLELQNVGPAPLNLSGFTFEGITYRFPDDGRTLAAGARLILSSALDPLAFQQRYSQLPVFGTFTGSLSNGGEVITLRDSFGNVVTQVEYDDENGWPTAPDGFGKSLELIDPNADASSVSNWKASALAGGSPGQANSFVETGLVQLNEIFATGSLTNPLGSSDWLELRNTGTSTVDLSGWSLADDSDPRQFVFPAGTAIPAGGFLRIWCDILTNNPGLHTRFALGARQESIFLFDANTNRVDAISYGLQIPTHTLGRSELTGEWTLTTATPAAPNEAISLSTNLVINEIFPNPITGEDDWLELHNVDTNLAAAVGGYYLGISNNISRLPDHSFIPAGGFVQLFADENYGSDHLSFKLPASGATLVLSDFVGNEIDRLVYTSIREGSALGRLPDGAETLVNFPASASPGQPNYLPATAGLQISEVLAASAAGDWIELQNTLATAVDLGGMSVSVDARNPNFFVFPAATVLAPGAYLLVRCDITGVGTNQTTGFNLGVGLNNHGGGVYLFDRFGQLADFVEYGAQAAGTSFGRVAGAWSLLNATTPGTANSAPAALGSPDLVRINEWMADPFGGDDWFEIFNPQAAPVHLGGLFITDDPSVSGRTNGLIPDLTFLAPSGFVLLQADGETDKGPEHVAFSLDAFGETLRLYNGLAVIDEIVLLPQALGVSEGRVPDGGTTITRFPGLATPGAPNTAPAADTDGDGIPDAWERANGLNENNPGDAQADNDLDGMSNLNEFRAGTNPNSNASILKLRVTSIEQGSPVLAFRAAANKTYSILATDTVNAFDWRRVGDIQTGTEREVQLVDDDPADGTRFYRIVSPMQP